MQTYALPFCTAEPKDCWQSSIYIKQKEPGFYKGRAATQRFDCTFAIDNHLPSEEDVQSSLTTGKLYGLAHTEHSVPYPWLQIELMEEAYTFHASLIVNRCDKAKRSIEFV